MLGYHTPQTRGRHPPPGSRHPPPLEQTPPRSRHPPGADTPYTWKQTPPRSRHPPREADSSIQSMSGRYASYLECILVYICVSFCSGGVWLLSMHHRSYNWGVCIWGVCLRGGLPRGGVGSASRGVGQTPTKTHGILQDVVNKQDFSYDRIAKPTRHLFCHNKVLQQCRNQLLKKEKAKKHVFKGRELFLTFLQD